MTGCQVREVKSCAVYATPFPSICGRRNLDPVKGQSYPEKQTVSLAAKDKWSKHRRKISPQGNGLERKQTRAKKRLSDVGAHDTVDKSQSFLKWTGPEEQDPAQAVRHKRIQGGLKLRLRMNQANLSG